MPAEKLTKDQVARAGAFVRRVVGLPYAEDASGPEAYGCRGLAQACQREVFERDLPVPVLGDAASVMTVLAAIARGDTSCGWCEAERPRHGDVVTLRCQREPQHIGVWLAIDRGRLLHAVNGQGVMFESRAMLELGGWGRFRFYRPAESYLPTASLLEAKP